MKWTCSSQASFVHCAGFVHHAIRHAHTHISICACVKSLFTTDVLCCLYVCFFFVSYMELNALLCKTFSSQTSGRGHIRVASLLDMNDRMLVDGTCHLIGHLCVGVVFVYLHITFSPGGDLQASSGNLDEEDCDDVDWEEERESERAACEGDDFIPPKIMVHAFFSHRHPLWYEPTAFLWTHHQILIKCSTAFWSSMGSLICVCFIHPCFWTANFIKSTKGWVRSQHHPPGRPLHNPYSLCEYSLMTHSYTGSKRIKVLIISIKPLVLSTTNDVCQSALACKV